MRWLERTPPVARAFSALTVALTVSIAAATTSGAARPGQVRLASPGPHLAGDVIGGLPAGRTLQVALALKVRNQGGLAAFLRAVSDPASPAYHDYLTPREFGIRFGATAAELEAVETSLRAHGLRPGPVPAGRLSIPVTATVGQVERAFSIALSRVALGGGRVATIASAGPAVDAQIAPDVQAVIGLSSVGAPHPLLERPGRAPSASRSAERTARVARRVQTGGPAPCAAASATATQDGAYTADQIASAYGFSGLYGAGDQGQGVTIAEYELEPDNPPDIAAYQACYGTHAAVTYVPVDGGAGTGEGSGEATLDIEDAIGLAPRAKYLVYQGPNANQSVPGSGPYDLFSTIINQDRANVISVSWGECEQQEGPQGAQAESNLFEQAGAEGQTIVSAAGDNGSEDCNNANNIPDPSLAVDDPASEPFVTGVGVTSMGQPGPPPTQTVWNDGGSLTSLAGVQSGAGGGGISALWGMPGYQSSAAASLGVVGPDSSGSPCGAPSGDCRQVPDVSADADPNTGYVIYFNGSGSNPAVPSGWQAVGGTSSAAPVWAALMALADAAPACHGSPVGFANPALYRAAGTDYASRFGDVTSGNNDYTATNGGLYPAKAGYDMATGLGTPNAAALVPALCADALRLRSPGARRAMTGQSVNLQLSVTGPPPIKPMYVANGLPPGLSLSRSTGRITGTPRKTGTFSVAVVVLDSNLAIRGTAFTWTIEPHPAAPRASISDPARTGHPKLGLTLRVGAGAPGLRTVAISLPAGLRFNRAEVSAARPSGGRLRARARLVAGRLVVTLSGAPTAVTLSVSYPSLSSTVPRSTLLRHGRMSAVRLALTVTDARGASALLRVRARLRG